MHSGLAVETAQRGPTGLAVQLIGKANGVGLARDLDLLRQALLACGCDVAVRAVTRQDRHRRRSVLTRWQARLRHMLGRSPPPGHGYDLNIMLEHLWPQFVHEARHNVAVPNPEWFDRRDVRFLWAADTIWAKTRHAQELFGRRGCRTDFVGFDSEDRYDPTVERLPLFFHLAGKSLLKGTARLLALWQRHPHWPRLLVVQDPSTAPGAPQAANIDYRVGYMDDSELRRLQNSCQFHLCLSEAEGWGHYIVEAMSVAAVVVSVDAPPMNELLTPERGVLVAARFTRPFNLSQTAQFDEQALVAAVERMQAMTSQQISSLGAAARSWYLDNGRGFHARIRAAIDALQGKS